MKKAIFLLTILFFSVTANSQDVSCDDLYNYVIDHSSYPSTINCFNSSWLIKVQNYDLDGKVFVVAYIKKNEYDLSGKRYIFCDVSSYAWSNFQSEGTYGSWGDAFHKYIMDYNCNCN